MTFKTKQKSDPRVIVPKPNRMRQLSKQGFGWLDARLHKPGAVGEQLPDRDPAGAWVVERSEMVGHSIVEPYPPFLHEHEDRRAGERLRHRGDPEDRVALEWDQAFPIRPTHRLMEHGPKRFHYPMAARCTPMSPRS